MVWKGLQDSKAAFEGLYLVMKTATQQGVLNANLYRGSRDVIEVDAIGNI